MLLDGLCYQSYNWVKFRPLGVLQHVVDMLEEYQCDEIAIIRPKRKQDSLIAFKRDLEVLRTLNTMTPICFGGGLRSVETLKMLADVPVERLIFSSAFLTQNYDLLESACALFGRQAIQCLLPIGKKQDTSVIFCCETEEYIPIANVNFQLINDFANEVVFYDIENEGEQDKFNFFLLDDLPIAEQKIIISGGIGYTNIQTAKALGCASVLIDNKVLHKEFSLKGYKHGE